jgi:hypothetical protein
MTQADPTDNLGGHVAVVTGEPAPQSMRDARDRRRLLGSSGPHPPVANRQTGRT